MMSMPTTFSVLISCSRDFFFSFSFCFIFQRIKCSQIVIIHRQMFYNLNSSIINKNVTLNSWLLYRADEQTTHETNACVSDLCLRILHSLGDGVVVHLWLLHVSAARRYIHNLILSCKAIRRNRNACISETELESRTYDFPFIFMHLSQS